MDRRRFLAAAGSLGIASLAGCAAVSGSPRPPVVPERELRDGGWKLVDESQEQAFEQAIAGFTFTATTTTRRYVDQRLADDVTEKTLGEVAGEMSTFFAAAVTFDPDLTNLPGGAGREELLDRTEENARREFESQMERAGLTNVSQTDTGSFDVDTGETARLTTYEADFPFEGFSFDVTNDASVDVEGDAIPVEGLLAVWYHDRAILVSGGAFPASNYADTTTKDLSDAVTVTVDIDLGLTPQRYREELRSLMRQVK
ncbi:MAG: hypothetical protein ABEJ22_09055 [Haloferacaceae archaeon]